MQRQVRCWSVGGAVLLAAAFALSGGGRTSLATDEQPAGGPANMQQLGALMVEGLKATPGCLGVDLAQARSGKNIIFAWFENKAAALAWYRNPVHVGAMTSFGMTPDADRKPMAGVPDDVPIMAVASLSSPPPVDGAAPGPRFSIELYTPLTGGVTTHAGANFSPAEFLKKAGK